MPSLHRCCVSVLVGSLVCGLTACGGSPRIEMAYDGEIDIPEGTRVVHIEVPTGAVTVVSGTREDVVRYDVYTLRQGADREALEVLEELDVEPSAHADGTGTLRISVPPMPAALEVDPGSSVPVEQQKNRRNAVVVKGRYVVPLGFDLIVKTGKGAISVAQRLGSVDAETGGGEIDLDGIHGRAKVYSANGNILVEDHRGPLDARTGRGDVFAWMRPEALKTAGTSQPVAADVRTRFGNIQAHLPTTVECELEVRSKRGEIENGFGLPIEEVGPRESACRGRIGEGGPLIRLISGFGNVSVSAEARLDG